MENSETKDDFTELEEGENGSRVDDLRDRVKDGFRHWLSRIVAFVSFGPGIVGILWLVGRILKR